VRALSPDAYLSSREVFSRAFNPLDSFDVCKTSLATARARSYVEKLWEARRPNKFRLTSKGAEIKRALERS
jgi:hypothetical protein